MKAIHAYLGGAFVTGVMLALTAVFSSSAAFAASPSPSVYLTPLALNWSKDGKSIIIKAEAKASVPATYRLPDDMTAMLVVERGDARGKSYRAPISLSSGKSERSGRVSIAVDGDHLTAAPAAHIFISAVFAWKTKILKPMACYGLRQQGTSCAQRYKSHTARAGASIAPPSGRPAQERDAPVAKPVEAQASADAAVSEPSMTLLDFKKLDNGNLISFWVKVSMPQHLGGYQHETIGHNGKTWKAIRRSTVSDIINYTVQLGIEASSINNDRQTVILAGHPDVKAYFWKHSLNELAHKAELARIAAAKREKETTAVAPPPPAPVAPAPQPEETQASIDIPSEPQMAQASASGEGSEGRDEAAANAEPTISLTCFSGDCDHLKKTAKIGTDESISFTMKATYHKGNWVYPTKSLSLSMTSTSANYDVKSGAITHQRNATDDIISSTRTFTVTPNAATDAVVYSLSFRAFAAEYKTSIPVVQKVQFDDQIHGNIRHVPSQINDKDRMTLLVELDPPIDDAGRTVFVIATPSTDDIEITEGGTMTFDNTQNGKYGVVRVEVPNDASDGKIGHITLSITNEHLYTIKTDKNPTGTITVDVTKGSTTPSPAPEKPFCHPSENGECLYSDQMVVSQKIDHPSYRQHIGLNDWHVTNGRVLAIPVSKGLTTTITFTCLATDGKDCTDPYYKVEGGLSSFKAQIDEQLEFQLRCGGVNLLKDTPPVEANGTAKFNVGADVTHDYINIKHCNASANAPFTIRAVTTRSASPSP